MSNDEASVLAKTVIFDDEQSLTASAITATSASMGGPADNTKLYLPAHNRPATSASEIISKKKKRHSNGGYYTHLAPTPPQDDFTTTSATIMTSRGDDPSSSDVTKVYSVISDQSVIKASEHMFAVSNPKQGANSSMVLEQLQEMPHPDLSYTVSRQKKLCISPPRKWVIALSFLLSSLGFTGAILLLVVLVLRNGDGSNTFATNEQNLSSVISFISTFLLENSTDNNSVLENTSTAQYQAAKWLIDNHIIDNFSLHVSSSSSFQILQLYVLAVLYYSTSGNEWTNGCNFLASMSVCYWSERSSNSSSATKGVISCSGDGKITGLSLESNNLRGSIPSEIGLLSSLESLYLQNNSLTGTIPSSLGSLSQLQVFWAFQNNLTGSIPLQTFGRTSLSSLDISTNNLTGSLPPDLNQLSGLVSLNLHGNHLNGTIPDFVGINYSTLKNLVLSKNGFVGRLPTSIGYLADLQFIYLFDNNISGTVPQTWAMLESLKVLSIYNNNLTGDISFLCNLHGVDLVFDCNRLSCNCTDVCQCPKEARKLALY